MSIATATRGIYADLRVGARYYEADGIHLYAVSSLDHVDRCITIRRDDGTTATYDEDDPVDIATAGSNGAMPATDHEFDL